MHVSLCGLTRGVYEWRMANVELSTSSQNRKRQSASSASSAIVVFSGTSPTNQRYAYRVSGTYRLQATGYLRYSTTLPIIDHR